jgi:hypothetical protein
MSPQTAYKFFAVIALAVVLPCGCSSKPAGDRPVADYNRVTGRLQRLVFDLNKDGKNDSVSYMDGTHIIRVELDLDENGKVERWDFYKPDGQLDKVGFASRNDGVMDSQAFYHTDGTIERIEISTHRDGRFDRTEFYDHNVLVRSQDDINGDGRPDKWDEYAPRPNHAPNEPAYAITATAFDDSHSGRPERRFVYAPDGTIARVEIDADGTGRWRPRQLSASTAKGTRP